MENLFITVNEVAKSLQISTSKAYQIIRAMNKDLKDQGYITIAGRVSRKYFESKVYGDVANAGV